MTARWTSSQLAAKQSGAKPNKAKAKPSGLTGIEAIEARRKATAETANQITKNILRIANLQTGCVAYRVNNVGVWDEAKQLHRKGNTEKGLPDVLMIYKGRYIGIEIKAGKDKLSDDQKKRKFEIERAGGVYFECRSTDDFLMFFEGLKNI